MRLKISAPSFFWPKHHFGGCPTFANKIWAGRMYIIYVRLEDVPRSMPGYLKVLDPQDEKF